MVNCNTPFLEKSFPPESSTIKDQKNAGMVIPNVTSLLSPITEVQKVRDITEWAWIILNEMDLSPAVPADPDGVSLIEKLNTLTRTWNASVDLGMCFLSLLINRKYQQTFDWTNKDSNTPYCLSHGFNHVQISCQSPLLSHHSKGLFAVYLMDNTILIAPGEKEFKDI